MPESEPRSASPDLGIVSELDNKLSSEEVDFDCLFPVQEEKPKINAVTTHKVCFLLKIITAKYTIFWGF